MSERPVLKGKDAKKFIAWFRREFPEITKDIYEEFARTLPDETPIYLELLKFREMFKEAKKE